MQLGWRRKRPCECRPTVASGSPTKCTARHLRYAAFEQHMDEYLEDEVEWIKNVLDKMCKAWDTKVGPDSQTSTIQIEVNFFALTFRWGTLQPRNPLKRRPSCPRQIRIRSSGTY